MWKLQMTSLSGYLYFDAAILDGPYPFSVISNLRDHPLIAWKGFIFSDLPYKHAADKVLSLAAPHHVKGSSWIFHSLQTLVCTRAKMSQREILVQGLL